jgi:Cohesin domain/PEP-CTERM motif
MTARIALALICFLLGTLAGISPSSAISASGTSDNVFATSLISDPPVLTAGSTTTGVGDAFTIPISVADAQGLTSFQFDLSFNPSVVQALSFTDIGTNFAAAATAGGGFLTGITGFINNTTGVLSGVADSISGLTTGTGLAPGGSLVNVTFRAAAVGDTELMLNNAFVINGGEPLMGSIGLVSGEVHVVPEPSSLSLMLLAVCGLAIFRWRRSFKRTIP